MRPLGRYDFSALHLRRNSSVDSTSDPEVDAGGVRPQRSIDNQPYQQSSTEYRK